MEGNNSTDSASISRMGSTPIEDDGRPPLSVSTVDATAQDTANVEPSSFSCEGYEMQEDATSAEEGGRANASASPTAGASSAESLADHNPHFDNAAQPLETQFDCIEKEFAAIEARTTNPKQYNFTTSLAFPTKNRYLNVLANEGTIFPRPSSPRAARSCGPVQPSTRQRILNTLRGSPTTASEPAGLCEDVASFRVNSVTMSERGVPLYFNANVVDLGVAPVFAASQAPVLDCIEDFLNVIYNYKIPLILMLTEVEEGGFVKAERYWPADRAAGLAGEVYGDMAVYKDVTDPYSIDTRHEIIRRPFFVRPCNVPPHMKHKVVMVQYVGWPDRGVPDSTESFEELLRIIEEHTASSVGATTSETSGRPTPSVLVHCSAGIGRTGTLIGAYAAIQRMRAGKLQRDSLPTLLLQMRRARFGMVQRIEQYMFLYLMVLQHLGVDTTDFIARMQSRADQYNSRFLEARQAAMAARAARK